MPLELNDLTRTDEFSETGARLTIARLSSQLADRLPTEITAATLSTVSKYPFKAAVLEAALAHRAFELGRNTVELFDIGKDLPAAFVSRAVMETAAINFHLAKRLERAVAERKLDDTDQLLMRGLMGWNAPYSTWKPLPVGTAIKHASREIPHFKSRYSSLSDVVHPNWLGTHGAFALLDERSLRTKFGKRDPVGWEEVLVSLLLALALTIHASSRVEEVMPAFVRLAERHVQRGGA